MNIRIKRQTLLIVVLCFCSIKALAYTAQFHAGSGLIDGVSDKSISEVSDGAGITLPTPTLTACSSWEFAGWMATGSPYGPTDELTQELYPAGMLYRLSSISEEFYAVYRHKTDRYHEIYVNDQLVSGGKYIVVNEYQRGFLYPDDESLWVRYVESNYNTWSSGYIDIDNTVSALDAEVRASIPHILTETSSTNHYWSMYNPYTEYYVDFKNVSNLASYNSNGDCVITRTGWNTFQFQGPTAESPIQVSVKGGSWLFPTYTYYPNFYVYRQQTFFATNPDCGASNYTVTFNAGTNGTCGTASITETGFHHGVVLPAVTPNTGGSACNALWEFAGWTESGSILSSDSAGLAKRLWTEGEIYYPTRNETMYAVYRRKSTTWEQVEDPNTLQAGEKIIIAYNTGSGYYTLSSAASADGYNASVSVGADQITTLDNSAVVWTLEGVKGAWRLKDPNGKHLDMTRSDYAYSYTYPWSRWSDEFTISGENDLSIRSNHADKRYLTANATKFSSSSSVVNNIRIFRQVTTYSKTPRCETYTVLFNSGEGTFGSGSIKDSTVAVTGISSSTGLLLSNASVPVAHAPACEHWKFAGWRVGSGLHATSAAPGVLFTSSDTYVPLQDSIILYAVYQNGDGIYYERISTSSQIKKDSVYVIADTYDYAVTTTMTNYYYFTEELIELYSDEPIIKSPVGVNIQWTYDGSRFKGSNGKYLSYAGNTTYSYAVDNSSSPFIFKYSYFFATYYLALDEIDGNYVYGSSTEGYMPFYIYMQKTKADEYNSWPHCTPFEVILNACGGKFSSVGDTYTLPETVAGDGVSLSGRTPTTDCDGWSLVGWSEKAVQARKTTPDGLIGTTATYIPKKTPDQLYAVYSNGTMWSSYPACGEGIEIVEWNTDRIVVESYTLDGTPTINGNPATDNGDGTYTFNFDVASNPCMPILIEWNGVNQIFQTPMLVTTYTRTSAVTNTVPGCATCDMIIMSGGTAIADQTATVRNITVYPGGRFNLASDKSFTATSLTMRTEGDELSPSAIIQGTFTCPTLYHERRIDNARNYWMALPYDVTISEIDFATPDANGKHAVYDTDYYLKYYDGVRRAEEKGSHPPYWTHIGDITDETYQTKTTLKAGRGYLVSLPKKKQANTGHASRTLRFPMAVADWSGETSVNKTIVAAGADCEWAQHVGWNLIGNPFLQNYSAVTASDIQCGKLVEKVAEEEPVGAAFVLEEGTTSVPYITLYDPSTDEYTQVELIGQNIPPFSAAFVQLPSGVSGLQFIGTALSKASAPARKMGLINEQQQTSRFRIQAKSDTEDYMTLIFDDRYTAAYEVAADLAKMQNGGKLNIYTIHEDIEHVFDALSHADGDSIAVGFMQSVEGEITIKAKVQQKEEDIRHLWIIDNEKNVWTDLLADTYTFYSEAGINNSRLWMRIERNTQETTNIHAGNSDNARKILHNGQLYIILDGVIYDAVGRVVKE